MKLTKSNTTIINRDGIYQAITYAALTENKSVMLWTCLDEDNCLLSVFQVGTYNEKGNFEYMLFDDFCQMADTKKKPTKQNVIKQHSELLADFDMLSKRAKKWYKENS